MDVEVKARKTTGPRRRDEPGERTRPQQVSFIFKLGHSRIEIKGLTQGVGLWRTDISTEVEIVSASMG